MKKSILLKILATAFVGIGVVHGADSFYATYPYPDAAVMPDTTAIHKDSHLFVSWADGYENMMYGDDVAENWKTPEKALGVAVGDSFDIVCLGRGGRIDLVFSRGISNGPGADFAVFENSFNHTFLELAWVEVSSDGEIFVRFPNYSLTPQSVGGFGAIDPKKITGYCSKYIQGYGTPFDLSDLQRAYNAALNGNNDFSTNFISQLTNGFPRLDLEHITHVRLVDVVGDGASFDARGLSIYDPYPTTGSAGADVDAVGVINQPVPDGLPQSITFEKIPHQKRSFETVELVASADSGLSTTFAIHSGPATVSGNVLTFMATGVVEVVASQLGDSSYAPATPILRAFHIADEIQHIFVEPIPNQLKNSGAVQINAYSSRGLPVQMEVYEGPFAVTIGETNHVLDLANEVGGVTLRAYQSGDAVHAPAEDVFVEFQIVEAGASIAPLTLAQWAALYSVPVDGHLDSDGDGVKNLQEFAMGSNPTNSSSMPLVGYSIATNVYNEPVIRLGFDISQEALGRAQIQRSTDLLNNWTNTVPEMVSTTYANKQGVDFVEMEVDLSTESTNGFFRLLFHEQ